MLKVLGTKRVALIVVLLAATAGVGSAYYYWLVPAREAVTHELQTTRAAVDQKYAEVAKMKEEFVLLQTQLRSFKELEMRGFFNDQDRSAAIDKLGKMSEYAKLLKAKLKFGKGQVVSDPLADLANQVVIKSPVSVEINSFDDVDIYSFVKFVEEKFPGAVDVTKLKLKRIEIFNEGMLRKIGTGDTAPLVNGELTFDWLTMAPKDKAAPTESGN